MKKFVIALLLLIASVAHCEDKEGGPWVGIVPPPPVGQGIILGTDTFGNPEWWTVGGGIGQCHFVRTSKGEATLNCPGFAPINNPHFTGTVFLPTTFATTIDISGSLTFGGHPVGGVCPSGQYVHGITNKLVPECSLVAFPVGPTAPNNPAVGDIWYDTSTTPGTLKIWSGTAWVTVGGGGGVGADSPVFTGVVTMPDGSTWGSVGLSGRVASFTNLTTTNLTTANLTVTGTVTLPSGSITDAMLSNAYSGVGACSSNQFITALNRNAPPTCATVAGNVVIGATPPSAPAEGQLWFNDTDLQTYIRYNGQWVPIVNVGGGGATPTPGPTPSPGVGGVTVGPIAPANPGTGELWLDTTTGQLKVWNGAWIDTAPPVGIGGTCPANQAVTQLTSATFLCASFAPAGNSAGTTAPSGPVIGQLWYDSATGTIKVWNGTSWGAVGGVTGNYAPLENPTGGQNNYAPLASPTFTGTVTVTNLTVANLNLTGSVTLPNSSIVDAKLTSSYSGVGSCSANQFVNALIRNAPPTCAAPSFAPLTNPTGGANNYASLSSPTFTGTVTLPAGTVLASPTFTGTVTMPNSSITDAMLARAYSGTGSCTSGQFVNALNRNAGPTCGAPAAGLWLPVNNPTFTGTLTGPIANISGVAVPGFGGPNPGNLAVQAIYSPVAGMTIGVGEYWNGSGFMITQSGVVHVALNPIAQEFGIFMQSGTTPGTLWDSNRNEYFAIRGPSSASGPGIFLENGGISVLNGGGVFQATLDSDVRVDVNNNCWWCGNGRSGIRLGSGSWSGLWLLKTSDYNPWFGYGGGGGTGVIYDENNITINAGYYYGAPNTITEMVGGSPVGQWGFVNGGLVGLRLGGFAAQIAPNWNNTALAIGNGYLTSNSWANVAMTGAAFFNGGAWVADGGAGSGVGLIQTAGMYGGQYWQGPMGAGTQFGWNPNMYWGPYFTQTYHQANIQWTPGGPWIGSDAYGNAPATAVSGSRDQYGEFMMKPGFVGFTFYFSQPFYSRPICTFTDDGEPKLWYAAYASPSSIMLLCLEFSGPNNTARSCTTGGYVMYHCTGTTQ